MGRHGTQVPRGPFPHVWLGRSGDRGERRFENLTEALLVWGAPLFLLGTWWGKAGLSVAGRGHGPRALGMRVPGGSGNMGTSGSYWRGKGRDLGWVVPRPWLRAELKSVSRRGLGGQSSRRRSEGGYAPSIVPCPQQGSSSSRSQSPSSQEWQGLK